MGEPCPHCGSERELILGDQYHAWVCPKCGDEMAWLTPEQAERIRELLATEPQRR